MTASRGALLDGDAACRALEMDCAARGFKVTVRPLGDGPRHLSASFSLFGDIAVASSRTTPVAVSRSRADISQDAHEFFVLPLHFGGTYTLDQAGREHHFEGGGTRLVAGNSPYLLQQRPDDGVGETYSLAIPAEKLRDRVRRADDQALRAIAPDDPGYVFLSNYVRFLACQAPVSPEMAHQVGNHLLDLAGLMLQPGRDQAEHSEEAVRAVRRRELDQLLDRKLADPAVDLTRLAQAMGISRRYVQMLFEGMGTSFSDELRRRRVERAIALIADPRCAGRSLADIAFACGFADLSTFNRSFRVVTGQTPSTWRRVPGQHE
ncbi:AraC family transcriptional regulator [Rhizobium sp. RU36D]|uniref:helix-turn-helix domain-containing protein n=1 Tax=Rhizobium sp. RU36D TaxID=1907415 RepID=UPI0015C49DF4|nr:AraC family transcriptional regulator [Rhizobium sp. RU36D]